MRLEEIDIDTRKRCSSGQFDAIKKAVNILHKNGLVTLRLTKEDHRHSQGYLQALDVVLDLFSKP